jgi:acyl carrier protein
MATLQTIQALLKANFDLAPEILQPYAKFEDLDIDSLSVLEVMFAIEDEFKITVPSKSMKLQAEIQTVGDLVAYVDDLIAKQHPPKVEGAMAS